MYQDCHIWGARDLGFDGIQWGEPVYAVEAGTLVFVYGDSTCFSTQPDPDFPNSNRVIPRQCSDANGIAILGDDGFFTEYIHVDPVPGLQARLCKRIQAGELIGHVGQSGYTTGPHVHFARYIPKSSYRCSSAGSGDSSYRGNPMGTNATCNWTMVGIYPENFSSVNWVQQNGKNYGYNNGVLSKGWIFDRSRGPVGRWYLQDDTGAWTGWLWEQGSYYYQFPNGSIASGWQYIGGQWWYFDPNNGNSLASNTYD
ncbi:peptidoglycan DD-metalloendopeptidase family protein [Bacillus sp. BRMEA1]|uniref:M23 family metallopeptidase n=1 Tax=Neobacillus endophyticus TaxID=2738405 RepID=UPI001564D786|nr:M23 family metallopeptidase [Neobacillus endophyticus]NRD79554.1 peptidoglycan DD-metalloendopeptidase family protein [Neobacillus endophyticus]